MNIGKKVKEFYNKKGWNKKNGQYQDSINWEDNRLVAKKYISRCRLRLARLINKPFKKKKYDLSLEVGCGPIQYKEYLKYHEKFKINYFLDISQKALDEAKKIKVQNTKFICANIVNYKFKNKFNLIVMNHVLYHIDNKYQKKVIYNLINALEKKGKLFVTYNNKYSLWNIVFFIPQIIFNLFKSSERKIYFYKFSMKWWSQFEIKNTIKIKKYPLRSISSRESKILIPDNSFGKKILDKVFVCEKKFPKLFLKLGTFYIIEITKK